MHRYGWLRSGRDAGTDEPPSGFMRRPPTIGTACPVNGRAVARLWAVVFVLTAPFCQADAAIPVRSGELIARKPAIEAAIQVSRVQLGSWRSALEAARGWNRIQRQASDTMDGLSARVVSATLPGRGTFYRLWVGPVDRTGVTRLCASLHARHIECIPAPR
jgi:hypothetical protein